MKVHFTGRSWIVLLLAMVMISACAPPEQEVSAPLPAATSDPMTDATRVPVVTAMPGPTLTPTRVPVVTYTLTPTIEPIPTKPPTDTPPPSLTPTITPTYLFTGTPVVPISGCNGSPASADLLINGSFEGGQQPQESADIQAPDGWVAYWVPTGTSVTHDSQNTAGYQRPEMMVISSQPPYDNPPRVFAGGQAFRMMGSGRAFDAGIMQQVTVTPGETFCLWGYAHAWSSFRADDPFNSTLISSDDRRNANFQLGIDPLGGANPWSSTVVWGQTANIYDEYQLIPPVQTQSMGGSITIFVRGTMLWRFAHNEMFFDAIVLARFVP